MLLNKAMKKTVFIISSLLNQTLPERRTSVAAGQNR